MKKIYQSMLFISFLLILFSCRKDPGYIGTPDPDPDPTPVTITPTPVQASVSGAVFDENNHPVAGASIKSGTNATVTDSRGLFRFTNIEMDKYASVVVAEAPGYFKGFRTFAAKEASVNYIKIKLLPKMLLGSVDAATGGSASLSNGSMITLQANSVIIKATGQAYTGNINIYAANIDPLSSDISQIVPGSFQASDPDNSRVLLKSFGMMAVQLEGQSGELLQIENGKTARLRFAIPGSLLSTAGATIPLWYLDESDGLWKQDGNATKTGNYYEGDVAHFSFWNCDSPVNAIYLELTVNTANGPLPGAIVRITRINSPLDYADGYTDSLGHVGGLVYSNEPLLLEIMSSCYEVVYSQNIGPFTQNTDLGSITVTISPLLNLTVSGNAVDCAGAPVLDGYAQIYWDGLLVNTPISNGSFSINLTRCSGSTAPVEVTAVDNIGQQQGSPFTATATGNGAVNTGTLVACGTSTEEFIYYTINGVNYSILQDGQNNLTANHSFLSVGEGFSCTGYIPNAESVSFLMDFNGITAGSSQSLYDFVSDFIPPSVNFGFSPQIFVNITEFGDVGQFVAGNFSGTMLDNTPMPAIVYNITCSFRIKRSS